MLPFLKLTRPLNLLIVGLTMWVMWWWLLRAICGFNGIELALANWQFLLLSAAVVLITAGGNVINDYFDQQIDKVNKPNKVIVGRFVKRRVAMGGHLVCSGLGILLGSVVAFSIGKAHYALVFVFAVTVLWYYSTRLKRMFLIGNITVALLSALVPVLIGLFEIPLLRLQNTDYLLISLDPIEIDAFFNGLWFWILGYAGFAFLSTLVRELQKDMADVPGDKAAGCKTVPIVLGFSVARYFSLVQHIVLFVALFVVRKRPQFDEFAYHYIGFAVILPIMLSAGMTMMAERRNQFVNAGRVMKLAMITAIIYALILSYNIIRTAPFFQ